MKKILQFLILLLSLALLSGIVWLIYKIAVFFISAISLLDSDVSVAIIAGSATIFASVLAVIISRYFQVKREQEIAHRGKKVELYDEFLVRLFEIFLGDDKNKKDSKDFIPFLREIQRKLILWAGPNAIKSYADWHKVLTTKPARAIQMIKMIDFFLALRKDLGHSNSGIQREHLVRFLLRNPELFMQEYKKNPNITFEEMSKLEKKLGLLDDK